jgi:hypothetical protein
MPRGLLTFSSAAVLVAQGAYYYAHSFLEMTTRLDALTGESPLTTAGICICIGIGVGGEPGAQAFDFVVVGGWTAGS